ncbi:MAG TPA: hypothetical protein VGE60_01910 [Telluria sp.]
MTEVQLSLKLENEALTIWRVGDTPEGGTLLGEYLYPELHCPSAADCYAKIGKVIVEGLREEIFDRIASAPESPVSYGLTDASVAAYLIDISMKTQTRAHIKTIEALLEEESDDPDFEQLRLSWPNVRERLEAFPD